MAAGGPIAGIAATTDVTAPLTAPIAPCHNASLVLAPDVFALKYAWSRRRTASRRWPDGSSQQKGLSVRDSVPFGARGSLPFCRFLRRPAKDEALRMICP